MNLVIQTLILVVSFLAASAVYASNSYVNLECAGLQDNGTKGLNLNLTEDSRAKITFVGGEMDAKVLDCSDWVGDKSTFLAVHCAVSPNLIVTYYYVAATSSLETSDVLTITNDKISYRGSALTHKMTCTAK